MKAIWSFSQIQGGRKVQEDFAATVENKAIFLSNNKDQINLDSRHSLPSHQSLFLLADGMGGMGYGDIAAAKVIDVFIESFLTNPQLEVEANLQNSLLIANQAITDLVIEKKERNGMGCTLIALLYDQQSSTIKWLSVGDSLLGIQRDQQWKELNFKHTWRNYCEKQRLSGSPLSLEDMASSHEDTLYSAVDGTDYIATDTGELCMQAGDVLIIASDGLEALSSKMIKKTIQTCLTEFDKSIETNLLSDNVDGIRSKLFSEISAIKNKYQDNTSVFVIRFA